MSRSQHYSDCTLLGEMGHCCSANGAGLCTRITAWEWLRPQICRSFQSRATNYQIFSSLRFHWPSGRFLIIHTLFPQEMKDDDDGKHFGWLAGWGTGGGCLKWGVCGTANRLLIVLFMDHLLRRIGFLLVRFRSFPCRWFKCRISNNISRSNSIYLYFIRSND